MGSSRNKHSAINLKVVDNDSTEISDLNSDSDDDRKGDGSGGESGEGTGQLEGSDDDFDQGRLAEKDVKQVLNDEVIFLFDYFFYSIVYCRYPRMF